MRIKLSNVGKRYNREWIFKHADLEFSSQKAYAITGPNGSGKSTFLQTIGGMLQPNEGNISFIKDEKEIPAEKAYEHISFCAPYLDLVEEMTLFEFLKFHNQFKRLIKDIDVKKIIDILTLQSAADKQIINFSSGMKQRVKLAQAIFSDTEIILLDEPCSNLDTTGIELYHHLIQNFCKDRIIIVSSNDEVEYSFCEERIDISDYK